MLNICTLQYAAEFSIPVLVLSLEIVVDPLIVVYGSFALATCVTYALYLKLKEVVTDVCNETCSTFFKEEERSSFGSERATVITSFQTKTSTHNGRETSKIHKISNNHARLSPPLSCPGSRFLPHT